MTQFTTLALQGRATAHTGLAALDTERLKRMRSQTMRDCFSHIDEQKYRMEFVARVRGMEFYNDAVSRSANATWYALNSMEGRLIWIATGDAQRTDYRRILPVARDKVAMMICVGPNADDMSQAFGGVVSRIETASSIEEAVHVAYRSNLDSAKVIFSPAGESGMGYEQEGDAFTSEVKEL